MTATTWGFSFGGYMIDGTNYINIDGWMVSKLGLRGKELVAYAIVHGFSQDGQGWYCGGRAYVAEWLGCQPKTAGAVLTGLVDKGLLIRAEHKTESGKCYRYQAVQPMAKNDLPQGRKTTQGGGEKRPTPGAKNAHITTKGDCKGENKRESGRFAPPTRDEVEDYAADKGYHGFPVDRFIAYYESVGWMVGRSKMKNWKASVTGWWLRDSQNANQKQTGIATDSDRQQARELFEYCEALCNG